jgi:hypothetical protein
VKSSAYTGWNPAGVAVRPVKPLDPAAGATGAALELDAEGGGEEDEVVVDRLGWLVVVLVAAPLEVVAGAWGVVEGGVGLGADRRSDRPECGEFHDAAGDSSAGEDCGGVGLAAGWEASREIATPPPNIPATARTVMARRARGFFNTGTHGSSLYLCMNSTKLEHHRRQSLWCYRRPRRPPGVSPAICPGEHGGRLPAWGMCRGAARQDSRGDVRQKNF